MVAQFEALEERVSPLIILFNPTIGEQNTNLIEFLEHGAASQTCGRDSHQEGSVRAAATPLDDEPDRCRGFLPERAHGLSDWAGAFPQREGDPGAGSGMETDQEVAVIPWRHLPRWHYKQQLFVLFQYG